MKVAITGHQDLGDAADLDWIKTAVREASNQLATSHGVSCRAAGADQLFAALVVQRELPLTVIIPCKAYVGTFTSAPDLVEYHRLLRAASERVAMPFDEPGPLAYDAANRELVDRADAIIAVWDGKPARASGGTAEVVAYARLRARRVVHVNPMTREVQTS